MGPKTIAQGAEAKIILSDNEITKDRISKSYRLPELDEKIRKRRTKAETKLLTKAAEIINAPLPESQEDKFKIKMPYINGQRLSEHLNSFPLPKQKQICKQIGESVAKLHDADIIHGDLTTSNMILATSNGVGSRAGTSSPQKIHFIDFGLGYISAKHEDKAVDLHLLKQALEAKHFEHWEELFEVITKAYTNGRVGGAPAITLERLKAVEKRGRYKH
jgi:TP53 regulating kinase and related kinases